MPQSLVCYIVPNCILFAYLIFVNFGTPQQYKACKSTPQSAQICDKITQNEAKQIMAKGPTMGLWKLRGLSVSNDCIQCNVAGVPKRVLFCLERGGPFNCFNRYAKKRLRICTDYTSVSYISGSHPL